MATMLGMAALLAERRDQLKHPVVLIFQPGDEGKGGACRLIDSGVLTEFGIEKMLCLHWVPYLPYGRVFTNKGGVTAYSSKVHIGLSGQGGHGSTPHLSADPMFLAAQIQVALQSMITREVAPQKSAVLSFGRIEAGEAYNVIAEETHLWGTLRSDDRRVLDFMRTRIEELVKGHARLAHLAASVEYTLSYGQVVNNDAVVSDIFKYGTALFGSDTVELLRGPLLFGEDFAFYSERVPSCMMFMGTGMEYGLYHARYDIPENLLPFSAAWCAYLALVL
jgi:amidohydrolase